MSRALLITLKSILWIPLPNITDIIVEMKILVMGIMVRRNLVIVIAVERAIVLLITANRQETFVMKERASTGKLLNLAWQEVRQDQMLHLLLEKSSSIKKRR